MQTTTFEQFAKAWTMKELTDGTTFWVLRDDSPQEFTDAVQSAHEAVDAGLPADWIYEACAMLSDSLDGAPDNDAEVCDGLVSIYTHALYRWASDYSFARDLITEAVEEYGPAEDHKKQIAVAQCLAYEKIMAALRNSLDA